MFSIGAKSLFDQPLSLRRPTAKPFEPKIQPTEPVNGKQPAPIIPQRLHWVRVGPGVLDKNDLGNILEEARLCPGYGKDIWTVDPRALVKTGHIAQRNVSEHIDVVAALKRAKINVRTIEELFVDDLPGFTRTELQLLKRRVYREASSPLGAKVGSGNTLRALIMHRFGGIYGDYDFRPGLPSGKKQSTDPTMAQRMKQLKRTWGFEPEDHTPDKIEAPLGLVLLCHDFDPKTSTVEINNSVMAAPPAKNAECPTGRILKAIVAEEREHLSLKQAKEIFATAPELQFSKANLKQFDALGPEVYANLRNQLHAELVQMRKALIDAGHTPPGISPNATRVFTDKELLANVKQLNLSNMIFLQVASGKMDIEKAVRLLTALACDRIKPYWEHSPAAKAEEIHLPKSWQKKLHQRAEDQAREEAREAEFQAAFREAFAGLMEEESPSSAISAKAAKKKAKRQALKDAKNNEAQLDPKAVFLAAKTIQEDTPISWHLARLRPEAEETKKVLAMEAYPKPYPDHEFAKTHSGPLLYRLTLFAEPEIGKPYYLKESINKKTTVNSQKQLEMLQTMYSKALDEHNNAMAKVFHRSSFFDGMPPNMSNLNVKPTSDFAYAKDVFFTTIEGPSLLEGYSIPVVET